MKSLSETEIEAGINCCDTR